MLPISPDKVYLSTRIIPRQNPFLLLYNGTRACIDFLLSFILTGTVGSAFCLARSVFERSGLRVEITDADRTCGCMLKSTRHGTFSSAFFVDTRGFPVIKDSKISLKPWP